jgi:4-nitrophenyl phosphatase
MAVRGLLLDVEGVLVGDKRYLAVPGAAAFVRSVRDRGLPLRLISNNTTDTKPEILGKLRQAGFDFSIEELHTCIGAAFARLRQHDAHRCLVLGTDSLRGMFAEAGFCLSQDSDVDAVVVGFDRDLTFERLAIACDAVHRHGAWLIALHQNRLTPDPGGRSVPSVGPIAAAIAYAAQVEPIVIGKPSRDYYQQVLDDIALSPDLVLIVSDDPFSDLAGGKRMGMHTAFVLSGKYADATVTDRLAPAEQPDVTVDRIGALLDTPWLSG